MHDLQFSVGWEYFQQDLTVSRRQNISEDIMVKGFN